MKLKPISIGWLACILIILLSVAALLVVILDEIDCDGVLVRSAFSYECLQIITD